jgi:hypothetical protein
LLQKQIQEADYGANLAGVKSESAHHVREHREIEQFQSDVENCVSAKANFVGDELNLYSQQLNTLQKLYAELLALSNKRLSDLETLLDFLTSVQNQMTWLTEKEKLEIARDWSDTEISISALEEYYEVRALEIIALRPMGEEMGGALEALATPPKSPIGSHSLGLSLFKHKFQPMGEEIGGA